ncbi:hypothetical protein LEP1GSC052_1327 [Leptospira kmetyi serovar Malaysia str. Bejo-Iso9]|nr:hypothetical protein LEP1GSC052_1327 [Leptospira kmetyi serovar Malaysia str. Bejo-Iso9]
MSFFLEVNHPEKRTSATYKSRTIKSRNEKCIIRQNSPL